MKIYNEEGEELMGVELKEELETYWKKIYQKHNNDIHEVWNSKKRNDYENRMKNENGKIIINQIEDGKELKIDSQLGVHFDAVMKIPQYVMPMCNHTITVDEICLQLKKTKDKRSPGPDGLKAQLIKMLKGSQLCMEELARCYNDIIQTGNKSPGWEMSHTKMIPNVTKPTVADLRPIALTDSLYKIFMGIIKEKIETHFTNINMWNELQAGFTRGRRITDNLYILKHCVERTYLLKRSLIVVSVDFQKAFDSILRSRLVLTMIEAKIDSRIINIIAQIYSGDKTSIYVNEEKKTEIEISSGIRQGCNGSTILFLLVTYTIIKELQDTNLCYEDNIIKIVALFFADDGLLMTEHIKDSAELIKAVVFCTGKCGPVWSEFK